MSISTYSELKTAIANWVNRTDLTDRIPEFIALCEQVLANDPEPQDPSVMPGVRCRAMEKRVTADVSTQYIDAPTDLLFMRRIKINTSPVRRLIYLTPEQMDAMYVGNEVETPNNFTIIGSEIQLAPIPDTTYVAEIAYYFRFPALSDANPTNWLLTNHPGIYLYGSLIHAEPFMLNDERLATWANMYRSLVTALNNQERAATHSGSALTMRVT